METFPEGSGHPNLLRDVRFEGGRYRHTMTTTTIGVDELLLLCQQDTETCLPVQLPEVLKMLELQGLHMSEIQELLGCGRMRSHR